MCHIVEALTSPAQDDVLLVAMALGIIAMILGWATYRGMDTRRKRDHAVTGAILGLQSLQFAAVLWLFAHGSPEKFVLQFLNFNVLKGSDAQALVRGVKYTLFLAFGGEFGGIAITSPEIVTSGISAAPLSEWQPNSGTQRVNNKAMRRTQAQSECTWSFRPASGRRSGSSRPAPSSARASRR